MIQGGNCYEMFFISFQKTISFFARTKMSDGLIEARICGTTEVFNFNENTLYQRELDTLRQINCNQC
jgi:hypothetical protein